MTTDERIEAMFLRTEEIHAHLVGTMDRRGLTRRVEDLERCAKTSWLRERGTKALGALLISHPTPEPPGPDIQIAAYAVGILVLIGRLA